MDILTYAMAKKYADSHGGGSAPSGAGVFFAEYEIGEPQTEEVTLWEGTVGQMGLEEGIYGWQSLLSNSFPDYNTIFYFSINGNSYELTAIPLGSDFYSYAYNFNGTGKIDDNEPAYIFHYISSINLFIINSDTDISGETVRIFYEDEVDEISVTAKTTFAEIQAAVEVGKMVYAKSVFDGIAAFSPLTQFVIDEVAVFSASYFGSTTSLMHSSDDYVGVEEEQSEFLTLDTLPVYDGDIDDLPYYDGTVISGGTGE